MINYFRSYVIIVCVVGVGVPIVVSTVWAATTGEIMGASLVGMILLIVLLLVSLFIMQFIMGRVADRKVEKYISYYDDECDPQKMLDESSKVRANLQPPYNTVASWFAAYCAQALLDVGDTESAQAISENVRESINHEKKASRQVDIIVNLVPVAMKLEGPESAYKYAQRGLNMLNDIGEAEQSPRRAYLRNQLKIADERINNNDEALIDLYESTRKNKSVAQRIRVEYAWDEARIFFADGNTKREVTCLKFVVAHGNKLALVGKAKKRLAALSEDTKDIQVADN